VNGGLLRYGRKKMVLNLKKHPTPKDSSSLHSNSTGSSEEVQRRPATNPSSDPVQFCQEAFSALFVEEKKGGMSLEELELVHLPLYFSRDYRGVINLREPTGYDRSCSLFAAPSWPRCGAEILDGTKFFRENFHHHRIRFRTNVTDTDGTSDVCLSFRSRLPLTNCVDATRHCCLSCVARRAGIDSLIREQTTRWWLSATRTTRSG
jgi:hypothetical protein